MRRYLILFCLIFLSHFTWGQSIDIGLWRDNVVTQRFYFMSQYESSWKIDSKRISIPANKTLYFTNKNGKIRLSTANKVFGFFNEVSCEKLDLYSLVSLNPVRKEEIYTDHITVTLEGGGLKIINGFESIDQYISGVVEAETGKEQNKEFYKVQSTISRTFALSNSRRHEKENFNLCDQVHCQVYHGISRFNPDIILATKETEGEVIVDTDINLITASFHSNCGGMTTNSEDVWSLPLPYLRSVRDTFCVYGVHYEWDKQISSDKWLEHLRKQYALTLNSRDKNELLEFESPQRERFLMYRNTQIERKELRLKWRLKSTFFNSSVIGSDILLSGRGHGHGVGLCQEGAMEMSRRGYEYSEILQHYYTDVHLIHQSMVDFFKDDN